MKPTVDAVWKRIRTHQGQPFSTITGMRFTYRVEGATVVIERAGYGVAKSNFERVLELVPVNSPAEITTVVHGSAYVWAILHDKRIRQMDW